MRYDQLANRWLIVVPVFTRPPDNPRVRTPCAMPKRSARSFGPLLSLRVSASALPDYPRPAIWPDGYYNPTSTSDNMLPEIVTQKHDCIADRQSMLKGLPATEQCVTSTAASFLNAASSANVFRLARPISSCRPGHATPQDRRTMALLRMVPRDSDGPGKTSVSAAEDRGRALPLPLRRPVEQLRLAAAYRSPPDSQGDKLMQGLVPQLRRPRIVAGRALSRHLARRRRPLVRIPPEQTA